MQSIPFSEFTSAPEQSLSWYDLLTRDSLIENVPLVGSHGVFIEGLLRGDMAERLDDVDVCAALIINGNGTHMDQELLIGLCRSASRMVAYSLKNDASRSIRMRCQRLVYAIQKHLSAIQPQTSEVYVEEETLDVAKPWDVLSTDVGVWCVCSGEKNIRFTPLHGEQQQWEKGLPTQIDRIDDHTLAFGSLYSNGIHLYDGAWHYIHHESPIVTAWRDREGTGFFVTHDAVVWRDQPREICTRLACDKVHFARYFDDTLYLMDNSDFGHIQSYRHDTGQETRHSVLPVWICNDMVATASSFYLIDKQQGRVFKFDKEWNFLEQKLSFGAARGQLCDPVSIRMQGDQLQIISWLTAKQTRMEAF